MPRALAALGLAALLFLPAAMASSDASYTDRQCVDPLDTLFCVTASMTLDLSCAPNAAQTHALCHAVFTWTTTGESLLPGQAVHAASALLEWCRPGAFCQGYGVGFLIEGCDFGPLAPTCSDTGTYDLYPGPIPLTAGQCMPVTLSGFARADGYLVNGAATFGQELVTAQVNGQTSTTFCQ